MNVWERYPKRGTASDWLPKSVPTDEYRVVYYLGFDRDDWDDMHIKAWSLDHAKERARELVPDCYRIKSVKPVDNQ
jgi:hypothetical protein|tara:strand:- start:977 stop:1204 length:228 start_codon:yes stop_codon:yes gene_type:complete